MANLYRLSLPIAIESDNNDDSFSKDILRQFDKRRSRLHFELGFTSKEPSPDSSIINISSISRDNVQEEDITVEPIQLDLEEENQSSLRYRTSSYNSKRSSSAGELFRRSSAFLKSKLNLLKKNKSDDNYISNSRGITDNIDLIHKKVLMKTTISIPSTANATKISNLRSMHHQTVESPELPTTSKNIESVDQSTSIPVITQYPPKPLVYTPIEPISTSLLQDSKTLLHRISMPLMRVYNTHESPPTTHLSRNRSLADFMGRRRKSEPDQHTKKKLRK